MISQQVRLLADLGTADDTVLCREHIADVPHDLADRQAAMRPVIDGERLDTIEGFRDPAFVPGQHDAPGSTVAISSNRSGVASRRRM